MCVVFSVDREGAIDRLVKLYKSVVYKTGVSKFNLKLKKDLKQIASILNYFCCFYYT